MGRPARGRRITTRSYPCAFGAALALLWVIAVLGQDIPRLGSDRPDARRPYARLPGAVTEAPDWIGSDAPFDVAAFFAAVPHERNASPLYLDAFFEFGSEMALCFPEGPERDGRRQAAEDRSNRYMALYEVLQKDPAGVSAEEVDAVVKLYESGFRKLAEAQRRDRCVFETGLGTESPLPHIQVARQVARVASLRVRRAVERRDFAAAIRDVEMMLRMVRDLQPRGHMISQLVAAAITQVVCADMVQAILAAPGLRVEHCDRLLQVFLSHEARASDGYAEGLRAEYLTARISLGDIVRDQPRLAGQSSPAEHSRHVRDLKNYYRTLLDFDGLPYARRIEQITTWKISEREDTLIRMLAMTEPAVVALFSQGTGRMIASLRATECLIIMRRWQLTHRGVPRALLVAAREAGLEAIPTDPYDGKPMRAAVLEGQTVVYSVGKDGHDDGAQKDSKFDTQPGDLIFRMPPVEVRHELAPSR
jgi:hypothetical protein